MGHTLMSDFTMM